MIRAFVNRALLHVAVMCLRAHASLGGQAPGARWFLGMQRQSAPDSSTETALGYRFKDWDPITEETLETRRLLPAEIAPFSKVVGERAR